MPALVAFACIGPATLWRYDHTVEGLGMVGPRLVCHLGFVLTLAAAHPASAETALIAIHVVNSDDDTCSDLACSINRNDHSGFTLALPAVAPGATVMSGAVDAEVDANGDTTVQLRWWDPDYQQYHYSEPLRRHTVDEPLSGFVFHIPPSSERRVLIVAPHPDDETLAHAGVIYHALHGDHLRHARVWVVVVTSGDAYTSAVANYYQVSSPTALDFRNSALARHAESLDAMARLGLTHSNDVLFLGYPDQGLRSLFTSNYDMSAVYTSSFTRQNEKYDPDAFRRDASPESIKYTGTNVVQDLVTILSSFRPSEVYVSDPRDSHVDHAYAYLCFDTALRAAGMLSATLYREIIHAPQQSSTYWPNPAYATDREARCTPTLTFETPAGMPVPDASFDFAVISADSPIRRADPATNLKRLAIDCYKSQIGWYYSGGVLVPSTVIDSKGYLISFAKSNELFWLGGHDGPDNNGWPASPGVQTLEQSASGQLGRQYSYSPLQQDVHDVWRLTVPETGQMRFRMETTGSDLGLRLYDRDGTTLLATFQQGGSTESFAYVFCAAGTYYVEVFIADAGSGGSYVFQDTSLSVLPCDFDRDCDVDVDDRNMFEACGSGPGLPYAVDCAEADLDPDGDVDQTDFAVFQRCYSGESVTADPNCSQ